MSGMRVVVRRITPRLYLLRVDDRETRFFEGLWSIPEGITYNAYLYLGEKNVLFDTWKREYAELFMETLRRMIDPRSLDYIVVHHMEPDHSGALPAVLREARDAVVLGHPLAQGMIRSFYGVDPAFKPVRDGERLGLGGAEAIFIHTPWLHWPETIVTYLAAEKTLLTCDAFGSYGLPGDAVYDEEYGDLDEYLEYTRKYFATVIGSYRGFVSRNIEKLRKLGLEIEVIAPSHGLLWRRDRDRIIELYDKWGRGEPRGDYVLVYYASMYGFVERTVLRVAEKLEEKGVHVRIHRFTDREHMDISSLIGDAADAAAIVVGAATYEAGVQPLAEYVTSILVKKTPPKPVLIVSSYGWGGVAAKGLEKIFTEKKFSVVAKIEYRGASVNEEAVEEAVEKLLGALGRP